MLTRNSIACWIFGLAICVFLAQPIAGKTIYVDADATGANDGSSWENAYNHLQDALADANSSAKPVQIRVAQGIYKPDQGVGITPGDREATFQLISGVAIRGGYAGFGEPDPNTRDIECYPTILNGDLIRHDETVSLVAEKAEKRVLVPSGPVMQTWRSHPDFNDSGWTHGTPVTAAKAGGVGYEKGSGYEAFITYDVVGVMYNKNSTCYIRVPFTVDLNDINDFDLVTMTLKVRYDDGFIAYLNGTEIARPNFTGTPAWNSPAIATHFDSEAVEFEDIDVSSHINVLQPGNNILAIHGLNVSASSSDFLISVSMELVGGYLAYYTGRSYHVLTGSGTDETALLDGFTITAGNASGDSGESHDIGGGMYNALGSPTVINCTFTDNRAHHYGGGMYNSDSCPNVTNCTFSANRASSCGGGMYNSDSYPNVANCTFSGNSVGQLHSHAHSNNYTGGGGMRNFFGSPRLTNCTFSGNSTEDDGGGMSNSGSELTVTNCTFSANSAEKRGGGMFNASSDANVANCTFNGNSAGIDGGGMYNATSSPNVTNCTFNGNSAQYDGGGMADDSGPWTDDWKSNPILTNCILWGNIAGRGGRQIYGHDESTVALSYCVVEGGREHIEGFETINWREGNIDLDPLLTPDGHLQAGSPCMNAGDLGFEPDPCAPMDIDGESRVFDGRVDIGSDEFLDTDGDGLPNWWEQKYFGDPNAAEPNDDSDGDGLINLDEYELYGSNPIAGPTYVNPSEGPFWTIQEGIDAAEDGDTVLVPPAHTKGPATRIWTSAGNLLYYMLRLAQRRRPFTANTKVAGFIFTQAKPQPLPSSGLRLPKAGPIMREGCYASVQVLRSATV